MSRKIIGVTVGTQLPKPNFKQTDPTKGDYIKNKPVGTEGQVVGFNENGNMVAMDSVQPDWNQTDENAVDFIKNKPEAITDAEIDAICGETVILDITENVLTDLTTGLVYRIYVENGKLSMKETSGASGTEELVFIDTSTDTVYKVYVEDGKLNMMEVE